VSERLIDPPHDLDGLVAALNTGAGAGRQDVSAAATDISLLKQWLTRVRDLNGSDLLLVTGCAPTIRASGKLVSVDGSLLDADDIWAAVQPVVAEHLRKRFAGGQAVDLAFPVPGLGRFRMNLHHERGRTAAAIRALPMEIPRLAALRFSHDIGLLSKLPRGLVLIGGPTGSGKTTTLAALISEINQRDDRHIVTVEDPIEFDHRHGRSIAGGQLWGAAAYS
jgi:twitching motility protein PilT